MPLHELINQGYFCYPVVDGGVHVLEKIMLKTAWQMPYTVGLSPALIYPAQDHQRITTTRLICSSQSFWLKSRQASWGQDPGSFLPCTPRQGLIYVKIIRKLLGKYIRCNATLAPWRSSSVWSVCMLLCYIIQLCGHAVDGTICIVRPTPTFFVTLTGHAACTQVHSYTYYTLHASLDR